MSKSDGGNLVSEWFGYRVYPTVANTKASLADQKAGRCPFLSIATGATTLCVKAAPSKGVCTVSSTSNGRRQDWLVCPHRTVTSTLVFDSAVRLFSVNRPENLYLVPAPTLEREDIRDNVVRALDSGSRVIAYLQEKVGGEISVAPSAASPEISFDFTLVELVADRIGAIDIGKYGILEVQTMDYHGSYRQVVEALRNALNLHSDSFAAHVQANPDWLARGMEGPNVANVFKRTFYQTVLKFKLAEEDDGCAGAVLALPQAVWDSWARHLGQPELIAQVDGTFVLEGTEIAARGSGRKAWVYIFDVDSDSVTHPNPVEIKSVVSTDAAAMSYHALERAAEAMVQDEGPARRIQANIRHRLRRWWPVVGT